jgi:hypothetical protein
VIFYKDMDDWVQELKGRRAVALVLTDLLQRV